MSEKKAGRQGSCTCKRKMLLLTFLLITSNNNRWQVKYFRKKRIKAFHFSLNAMRNTAYPYCDKKEQKTSEINIFVKTRTSLIRCRPHTHHFSVRERIHEDGDGSGTASRTVWPVFLGNKEQLPTGQETCIRTGMLYRSCFFCRNAIYTSGEVSHKCTLFCISMWSGCWPVF